MIFAEDIHERIKRDFPKEEVDEIEAILKQAVDIGLNVGEGQFVRSVIFLSNKDKDELERILDQFDDPRDVVSEAEDKSGNLGHWFAISFEEIEQLNGEKYSGEIFKETQVSEDDGLPF